MTVLEHPIISNKILLKRVLRPYKENCHYLKNCWFEFREPFIGSSEDERSGMISARGEFSIPESCYIVDTGHFNAVEFNICYNQLGYCLLAECIQHQVLNDFLGWKLEEYFKHQLSNIFIAELRSSFHRPMRPDKFTGHVEIKKISNKEKILFLKTICRFEDDHGGFSSGKILIAIIK